MYRHQLRFVLRFGVRGQFSESIDKLAAAETARGWALPRVWQAMNGLVNEIVIEHEYESFAAFQSERTAFHDDPGECRGRHCVAKLARRLGDVNPRGAVALLCQLDVSGLFADTCFWTNVVTRRVGIRGSVRRVGRGGGRDRDRDR